MTIRTNLKAGVGRFGGGWANHNEAMRVRTSVKAGMILKIAGNHNEALRVRSQVRGGRVMDAPSLDLAPVTGPQPSK